jgi:hypothetical protein
MTDKGGTTMTDINDRLNIAEAAARARVMVARGQFQFDTAAQRDAAAAALEGRWALERITAKVPGRFDRKPTIKFL